MSGPEGTRYRFGPRERGGVLAGWRTGQVLTVAVGLVFGVLVLRWSPDALGVVAAIVLLVVYGALATVPVAGRTGDEWLPVVVCWSARRVGGPGRRFRMRTLRNVALLQAAWHDMGVVHDRATRTLTAVLALEGGSFALLGADEQDRRVSAWASVLAAMAREGSPVHRIQWLASSHPDDGEDARSYLAAEAAADPSSACTESYERLLAETEVRTSVHGVHLAIQVRVTRSVEVGCAALAREVDSLVHLLAEADVRVEALLSAPQLAGHLARTYESHPPTGDDAAALVSADPWPMAMDECWSHVRVDGLIHATFWVAEWPRVEVRSDFLAPVLLGSARSTFGVVMEPLAAQAAVRKTEASRTADLADAELRRRGGFVSTARHTRESEVLARREAELADGHASFRYSGYVTVSAPTVEELEVAVDQVRHAAGQSRLALRRLYGDQAAAYTCTLPLCRGLR